MSPNALLSFQPALAKPVHYFFLAQAIMEVFPARPSASAGLPTAPVITASTMGDSPGGVLAALITVSAAILATILVLVARCI